MANLNVDIPKEKIKALKIIKAHTEKDVKILVGEAIDLIIKKYEKQGIKVK